MSGTIAAGSLVEYGYTSEVVFGSTPTGRAFKKVRDVGFSLNLQKEIYQSEERKTDRMRQDARHGYRSVAGEVNGDISEQSWDDFLEAVIGGTWANITPVSTTLNISINSTTNKITSLTSSFDFLTSGITVGDVFFVVTNPGPVSGFSGEYLTVLSASASTIEVEPNTITTTAASVSVARIYEVGRKVSIGNTYRSFTFERWLTDRNLYQQFRGVRINQVTFSIPASGLASLTFGVLGQDATIFSSTTVASVYSEAPQTTPFAAVNGALFEGGQVLGLVTAAEITLNNNMASSQVVGSNIVPDILFGRYADVTGTITVLFSDASALNKFVDQIESSLVIRLQNKDVLDQDTQFINLVLPRIKYSGGDIDDGVEGGVTLTLPFIALAPLSINPAQGSTSLFIQASNVVPRTEVFSFLSGVPSGWTYSRASNATYFNSSGVLTVASADVARVDYDPSGLAVRGLLCEPSRVNWVRNSIASATVAGTPGTLPTTWSGGTASSVTRQIVGTGTEDGIEYIDLRWAGNGGEAPFEFAFDIGTHTSAAQTEVWTGSVFLKLVAGSFTGLGGTGPRVYEFPGVAQTTTDIRSVVTGAALRTQRIQVTRTNVNAGTTYMGMRFLITPSATAWDFTLRFGLPQLELGSFATSPIRTSGATVTRAADRLTYDLAANAPWFQSSNGYTYGMEYITPSLTETSQVILGVSTGSFRNSNYFDGNNSFVHLVNGISVTSFFDTRINAPLQTNKVAATVNFREILFTVNNSSGTVLSNPGYPNITTLAVLSSPWSPAGNYRAGWARTVTLSNYRYTAAELRSLTT